METKEKRHKSEHIMRVIELCKSVEEKGVDPFALDIDDIIAILKKYFPEWESPEELVKDTEAVRYLASVIENQGNWVKQRSTSLYTDPFLLEEKIQKLDKNELVEIFVQVWNPVIEMEQLSTSTLAEALQYWNDLIPIDERWRREDIMQVETSSTSFEELVMLKILAEKTFREELETFWGELKEKIGKNGKILYWDFVGGETFQETLDRAYKTSFLVTYGYATLELIPLEEEVYIKPFQELHFDLSEAQMVSVPISVSHEEWIKWKEEKRA